MPAESRYFKKAFGEWQYSSICAKLSRLVRINSSADGLNMSIGEIWMWQSVIKSVVGGSSLERQLRALSFELRASSLSTLAYLAGCPVLDGGVTSLSTAVPVSPEMPQRPRGHPPSASIPRGRFFRRAPGPCRNASSPTRRSPFWLRPAPRDSALSDGRPLRRSSPLLDDPAPPRLPDLENELRDRRTCGRSESVRRRASARRARTEPRQRPGESIPARSPGIPRWTTRKQSLCHTPSPAQPLPPGSARARSPLKPSARRRPRGTRRVTL